MINAAKKIGIIVCPGAVDFAKKVLKHLETDFDINDIEVPVKFVKFINGEIKCQINESIRGRDIFIFQDIENHNEIILNDSEKVIFSVNDHLMTLLTAIDAAKHASAFRTTLVLPSFPYARQHRKTKREGLTAAMLCHWFEQLHVGRIITLDIHSREIQNAFLHTILENLHASYQIIKALCSIYNGSNNVVVSPDSGAIERNKFFANALNIPLAMIYKERDYSKITDANSSNIINMKLIGDVKGKTCFIFDDMIDTGGSFLKAAALIKNEGAKQIIGGISLPFFNHPAIPNFNAAYENKIFSHIIGTNAVYNPELWSQQWFVKADVTRFFAEIIYRLANNATLSGLLDSSDVIKELLWNKNEC